MAPGGRSNSSPSPGAGLDLSGVSKFADRLHAAATIEELSTDLGLVVREPGFPYHALVHHAEIARPPPQFMFLQNYPARWVQT
jgi:hypothetical protein